MRSISTFRNIPISHATRDFHRYRQQHTHTEFEHYKCLGAGQRPTPVASFTDILQILNQLLGHEAHELQNQQAILTSRAIAGDDVLEQTLCIQHERLSISTRQLIIDGLGRTSDIQSVIPQSEQLTLLECQQTLREHKQKLEQDTLECWLIFAQQFELALGSSTRRSISVTSSDHHRVEKHWAEVTRCCQGYPKISSLMSVGYPRLLSSQTPTLV